ncbi:T cell receptor alpha variable 3 [Merluccius polli]|nr:T cell receptor alpha variable 3 [Merluccius polli]
MMGGGGLNKTVDCDSPVVLQLALHSLMSQHHALCTCGQSVEDSISPQKDVQRAVEDAGVVLSCTYNSSLVSSLLWYRQYPGSPPQFLIMDYSGYITSPIPGLNITHIEQQACGAKDLLCCSDRLCLYYCGLRPTVTANTDSLYKNLLSTKHTSFDSYQQTVHSIQDRVQALQGDKVTLSCNYSSADSFFWYLQYPSSPPQLLIKEYKELSGFILKKDKEMFHLEISSAVVTDSALYYCAVRPTVTGNTDSLEQFRRTTVITLSYNFSKLLLLAMISSGTVSILETLHTESLGSDKRFSTKLTEDKTGVDLKISSAVVTDSALYYCAEAHSDRKHRLTCKGEDRVIQTREDVIATEGHTVIHFVTLTYGDLMMRSSTKTFDAQIQNTSVPLRIQNLQLLTLLCTTVCKGEDRVIQTREDVIATEGHTVSLGVPLRPSVLMPICFGTNKISTTSPVHSVTLYVWRRHNAAEFNKDRFDAQIQNTSVPLRIQNLQMSDSALYYCGLKPTVTGNTDSLYKNLLSTKHTSLSPETRRQTLLTNRVV